MMIVQTTRPRPYRRHLRYPIWDLMHAVVCLLVSQVVALVLEMRSGQVQGPKRDWVPLVLDLVRRSDLRLADY